MSYSRPGIECKKEASSPLESPSEGRGFAERSREVLIVAAVAAEDDAETMEVCESRRAV